MSTVPNFLNFTINAVLHPTFIRKLCYEVLSSVTFTYIEIMIKILSSLLNGIKGTIRPYREGCSVQVRSHKSGTKRFLVHIVA